MTQAHSKLTSTEDSLASIQLDRLSVEDEAALMNNRRVWQLRAAIAGAVVVAFAAVVWMKNVDSRAAYVETAASVAALRTNQIAAFMQCAAPGTAAKDLASKAQVQAALESASQRFAKAYPRTLVRCSPILEQVATGLAALRTPSDLAAPTQALAAAAKDLQQTVEGAATVPSYDTARMSALLAKIAAGLQTYDERESAFQTAVHSHAK